MRGDSVPSIHRAIGRIDRPYEQRLHLASDFLSAPRELGCAHPLTMLVPPATTDEEIVNGPWVRVAGHYRNILAEGPGRRSRVK